MSGISIVVIGSECTGKTTTSQLLAAHFTAPWVPEAARLYAEEVARPLGVDDVELIARLHLAEMEEALLRRPPLLILDTDLISTMVYSRHYYGSAPRWIEREARARLGNLYLLAGPDIPWTPDSSRDRGHLRAEMHQLFLDTLEEFEAPVSMLYGLGEVRGEKAIGLVERFLSSSAAARGAQ